MTTMSALRVVPLILFMLFRPAAAAEPQSVWSGVSRVVAIGDVHGDYEQFVTVLRSAGLIDGKDSWIGGEAHLVQTGDVVDRGPDSRKVMDLLMRLEQQSWRAGGFTHVLIGNHEAMNVYGDLRYVSAAEYAAFQDSNSEQIREAMYQQYVKEEAESVQGQSRPVLNDDHKRAWLLRHPLGYFEHRYAFGPKGKYGRWIRGHNIAVKINDTLFLHGGISPKYLDAALENLNRRARQEMEDFAALKDGAVADPEGPLWYRGLAEGDERSLESHVNAVLTRHGCSRIVIGHTVTTGTVMPRFSGKVVMIDVGLSAAYGGRLACLIVEAGKAYTLHRGQKLPVPVKRGERLLEYIESAAVLDPKPSPLASLILRLKATGDLLPAQ
jgi:hypothetical protein